MKTVKMDMPTKVLVADTNFIEKSVRALVCLETFKEYLEELKRCDVTLDPIVTNMANTVGSYINEIIEAVTD